MSENKPNPWLFIPLNQFSRPAEPTSVVVRKGLREVLASLRKREHTEEVFLARSNLTSLPPYLLARVAAPPDWSDLVPGLDQVIGSWVESGQPDMPIQVVVGPPYSGAAESLALWGKDKGWRVVSAPEAREILSGASGWIKQFKHNGDQSIVIPHLEHLYLRHQDGLSLVRELLDWLWHNQRPTLIGCDSWAWAFLSMTIHLDTQLPGPLTLGACDHLHLQTWLQKLAAGAGKLGIVFRQSDNGGYVLPPTEGTAEGETPLLTDYLKKLAVISRGNPGVAWAMWRHSLQYEADENVEAKAQETAAEDQSRVMWVKTWSQIDLPGQAFPLNQLMSLCLHALLLHGGLPASILHRILPYPRADITQTIQRLQSAGLVEQTEGRSRVTALGYTAVRDSLSREGFLVDAL